MNIILEIDDSVELWKWIRHNLPFDHSPVITVSYRPPPLKNVYFVSFQSEHTESAALLKLFWG